LTKKNKFGIINRLTAAGAEKLAKKLLEKYIVMRRTRGQNKTKKNVCFEPQS
jgi:hypothetical protein